MQARTAPAIEMTAPAGSAPGVRAHTLLVLLLWGVTLLAYSNSFHGWFVLDNEQLILNTPKVQEVTRANLKAIWTEDYWVPKNRSGLYRPFTSLTLLFNYAVLGNGVNPAGYHWFNLVVQWVNLALLYLLALRVFGQTGPAFATAALWGLHPVATEAVTNIVGRADLLAAAGVLGALLCHIHAATLESPRKIMWLAALALLASLGFFSKESAAVLPAVMLVYDVTFVPAGRWRSSAAGYLAVLPVLGFYLLVRNAVFGGLSLVSFPFLENPLTRAGFWGSRLTAVKVIGRYLWLLIYPRHLSCDYSYNQVPLVNWPFHGWQDWQAVAAVAVCILLAFTTIISYRRSKALCFWIALFLVALLPASNLLLLVGTVMGDRLLYLPSIGFAACLAMAIFAAARRFAGSARALPLAWGIVAVICSAWGARTWARNLDWKTPDSFWASAVVSAPASFKTHLAYAELLHSGVPVAAALDRSIAEIEQTLAILRDVPGADNVIKPYLLAGVWYREKGDQVSSSVWYEKSRDVLVRGAAIHRARNRYLQGLEIERGGEPREHAILDAPTLYHDLGITYLRLKQPREALESFEVGQRVPPGIPTYYADVAEARRALEAGSSDPR